LSNSPYQPAPSSPNPWGSPNQQPQWRPQYGHQTPQPGGGYGYPGPQPGPQPSGALAIIAFIIGIIAFFVGWVPFVGLVLGFVGLVLSIIAVRKPRLRGLSITGIILSILAGLTSLVTSLLFVVALLSGSSEATTTSVEPKEYSPEDFQEVDERALAEIVKDPDAHAGEAITIYGYVSQFGTNTGPCRMQLEVSHEPKDTWFDYDHNALAYSGDHAESCPEFDGVLEEDQVKLSVVVIGSESYSTLLGGSNSAPALEVVELEQE
jgi:hypothetical protein